MLDTIVEYKKESGFKQFFADVEGKKVGIICDKNTQKYADEISKKLSGSKVLCFYQDELVGDEGVLEEVEKFAENADYLLAVGSGTLNDIAKLMSTKLNIGCGVLATAPSMDGYASKNAAIMQKGFKKTLPSNSPKHILIDLEIVKCAPQNMIAAGMGDILGKFSCLLDWKMSHILMQEDYNYEAAELMCKAVDKVYHGLEKIRQRDEDGIAWLMDALITAGFSMAMCGNSRPASGGEHHLSHYIEMDCVKRKVHIPLHGLKVGLETLVTMKLYQHLLGINLEIPGLSLIKEEILKLPTVEDIQSKLISVGAPIKYSQIGVSKGLLVEALKNAYTVRDRFTILTFYNKYNLMDEMIPILVEEYL